MTGKEQEHDDPFRDPVSLPDAEPCECGGRRVMTRLQTMEEAQVGESCMVVICVRCLKALCGVGGPASPEAIALGRKLAKEHGW